LNGKPEIDAESPRGGKADTFFIGGRAARKFGFEGRIAEVAVYDRPLTVDEMVGRVTAVRK
jgi:hypothetical protein